MVVYFIHRAKKLKQVPTNVVCFIFMKSDGSEFAEQLLFYLVVCHMSDYPLRNQESLGPTAHPFFDPQKYLITPLLVSCFLWFYCWVTSTINNPSRKENQFCRLRTLLTISLPASFVFYNQ